MSIKVKPNNSFKFIILLLILLPSFGLYLSLKEKNELKKFSKETVGTIFKIDYRKSRGYYVHYTYQVSDKVYKRCGQYLTIKRELVKEGDMFTVIYSYKTPNYSKLLFEKRIKNK